MKFHYKIKQESDVSQRWKQLHTFRRCIKTSPGLHNSSHSSPITKIKHFTIYSAFHRPLKPCMRAPLYSSQWCQTVTFLFSSIVQPLPSILAFSSGYCSCCSCSRMLLFLLPKVIHTTTVYDFN